MTSGQNEVQDVQLCRVCFATDVNIHSMKLDKNLDQAYGTLTGLIENEDNMPPYLCAECSHQLMNCIHFRKRSLQAHLLLLEVLKKHECITLELIKSISGRQPTSNLDIANAMDQYDLETVHIKKEKDTDDEMCLANEPNLFDNDVLNNIKEEDNNTFGQDSPKDENTVYSSSLHEDSLDYIKAEKDDVYNEESIDDEVPGDDIEYSEASEGEHSDIDYISPSTKRRQKPKQSITELNSVTKEIPSKDLRAKTGNRLLLYDNLCCDKCPYKTTSDIKLLRHLKTHEAPKSFYTSNIKQKCIPGESGFSCKICKKTFSRKWSVQKHMKTHSGEKPYNCDLCEKRFNENRDLQNHLRTHSGEKPYGCDLCKKTFSERGNLLRHIRIHSGEKPYSCKFCKVSYSQKHHLKRHLTKHY